MKSRILIDATTVIEKQDGLSQYIISFLDNIPADAFESFEFLVLVNKDVQRKELWDVLIPGKFKVIKTKIAPIGPKRDWDMFWWLRKHKNNFDLFHSTSNQYPPGLKNGIATIHDITFRKYLDAPRYSFNMAKRFLNMVIKRSLNKSAAVIAVSDFTKNELVNNYKLNKKIESKIEVVYEGWEHLINDKEAEVVNKDRFDFDNYLFYVGTTRVHKNMKNLLKAFVIAEDKLPVNINLVVSGNETYLDEEDKKSIAAINANGLRIFFTGFVEKNELEYLFRKADAFIFPSLSEGFGIPVLEAFYFKKPLLCSNTTSLPEIAGNAALYFNPSDPKDIAHSILSFYDDPAIGQQLVIKGEERLKLFSWKKTVQVTIQLYKNVLLKNK